MRGQELLTREQAAEYLGVTKRWLADNWREGPEFYRLNARVVRYTYEALDEWLETRFVQV